MANKKTVPLSDSPRKQWLRCRVNDAEAAAVKAWLDSLNPQTAVKAAAEVAARIRAGAPFANSAAFFRAVLGLPEIGVGAPVRNRNAAKKKAA